MDWNLMPAACPTCRRQFPNEMSLRQHQKTDCKVFPCEICEKPFCNKSDTNRHKNTHMNDEELKGTDIYHKRCEICNHRSFSKSHFDTHMNTHNEIKKFPCKKCNKRYSHKISRDTHMVISHSNPEQRERLEKSWKYFCTICKRRFRKPSDLKAHSLVHVASRPYKCSVAQCPKDYKSRRELNSHLKTTHKLGPQPSEKGVGCEVCGNTFANEKILRRHKLTHEDRKDYRCGDCQKTFTRIPGLIAHVNTLHLKIKPFNCKFCDSTFTRKIYLQAHSKTVHGQRQ